MKMMKTSGQIIKKRWTLPARCCPSILRFIITACVCMCVFFSQSYPSYGGTTLQLWHAPLTCATPGSSIKIFANITAPRLPKEARVYFRKQGTAPFYFVWMKQEGGGTYTGVIPAPVATTTFVEYVILVVENNETIQRSPLYTVLISNELGCPKYLNTDQSEQIVVYAESPTQPEVGFSGKNVQWNVSNYSGKAYLNAPMNVNVQGQTPSTMPAQEQGSSRSLLNKKTVIGLGVGIGAAAAAVVLLGGEEEKEKVDWNVPIGERADDVKVEFTKIPEVQTSCGTLVLNQLYVTNKRAESLSISSIDYEVVLTKDDPAGSCEGGRAGMFTPNLATVVQPGETALIREWSNVVNSCDGCPYFIAECQWRSRYIIHTSVGDAIGESTFTVEGDLCGLSTAKSLNGERLIRGDMP